MDTKNVGIVGCGLIGKKRMQSIAKDDNSFIKFFSDIDSDKAKELCLKYDRDGSYWTRDFEDAIEDSETDIIVIATPNNMLYPIAMQAVKAGKSVLIEKPGAMEFWQLENIFKACANSEKWVVAQVGYNLRYHPAILKAKQMIGQNYLGRIFRINGYYGHGGRVGYEKEWRADPYISGGGVLMDLGSHLIDLAYFFTGTNFSLVNSSTANLFWKKMPVEDTATIELKSVSGYIQANFMASCSEWKNTFSYEIYGEKGKLHIAGLGGSYGTERLCYYKMFPEMGVPEITAWEYCGADKSWDLEWKDFIKEVNFRDLYIKTSGLGAMYIIEEAYGKSEK